MVPDHANPCNRSFRWVTKQLELQPGPTGRPSGKTGLLRLQLAFRFSERLALLLGHVRERVRLAGLEAIVGSANFHERVTDGVRAWQQREAPESVPGGRS